jgi:two-component system LytT family response regulator
MPIRTIIVDDEELARARLLRLLRAEPDINVVAECADGPSAVAAIAREAPDLMLLDVQMPEIDGFGVLERIDEAHRPVVIFVTAYDRYALQAFDAYALDYLLKPFNRSRFHKALQRARLQIGREQRDQVDGRLAALLKSVHSASPFLDRLVIRSAGRVVFLRTDDVEWFEACANYVRLHLGKETHLLRGTMNVLESQLDPEKFVRIHRCTIVKVERIKELRSSVEGEYAVILQDGTRLHMSRSYRRRFDEVFQNSA